MVNKKPIQPDLMAEIQAMQDDKMALEKKRREACKPAAEAFGIDPEQAYKALEDVRVYNKFWKGKDKKEA